jgi:hypothetical protein
MYYLIEQTPKNLNEKMVEIELRKEEKETCERKNEKKKICSRRIVEQRHIRRQPNPYENQRTPS